MRRVHILSVLGLLLALGLIALAAEPCTAGHAARAADPAASGEAKSSVGVPASALSSPPVLPAAQNTDASGAPIALNPPPKDRASGTLGTFHRMTEREFKLSVLVIGFGLFSLGLSYVLVRRGQYSPNDTLRLLVLQLIIVGTLFCITAGFSSQDIAPAMGLFGTIAGYLLGKAMNKDGG